MQFRTNEQFTWLRTPGLGEGSNPPVTVTSGGTVNLSNTFAISPGYLDGRVVLQGPAEDGVTNSIFRGVERSIQADPSLDGIPHAVAAIGNEYSMIGAFGENRLATGATLTAVNGECLPSLQGDFNPLTSAFEGSYEAVVGGLNSERSIWQPKGLYLALVDVNSTNEDVYYDELVSVTDLRTNDVEVAPGLHYTNDVGYCFSEVQIRFRSTSASFYAPGLNNSSGTFIGTDFQGHAANYTVLVEDTSGTPVSVQDATNSGLLRMALPQGTYTLYPYVMVINPDGSQSRTGLSPITLPVGCQQRIFITSGLQVQLTNPACTADPGSVPISGQVIGSNQIASITVSVNGGPTNVLCNNCGLNPTFNTAVSVSTIPCSNSTITVGATDILGNTASTTTPVLYSPQPPSIVACPSNITVACAGLGGTAVSYSAQGVGGCPGPVTVVFTPPSGTLFPAGTNTVTCYALDGCGRQSSPCTFTVTVTNTNPPAILCPPNLVVNCAGTNGTPVVFHVVASSGCDTNVTVVTVPASGSLFPVGTNIVTAVATDHSGNPNQCSFLLIVQPSASIELTVTVNWCGNGLQESDNANGPWVDIPSPSNPYTVPVSQAKQFYRAK
ncbi:hypothetical protein SBV1_870002 [Verrucomicrobia bacterium]|nr:hypothetical protein SBV1_870002 [Verrucomicrobiota bacterium]